MVVRRGVKGDMRKEDRIRSNKLSGETGHKCEHDCQANQSVSLNECFLFTSWKSRKKKLVNSVVHIFRN